MAKREYKVKSQRFFEVNIADLKSGPLSLERSIPLEILRNRLKYCEYDAEPISASVNLTLSPLAEGILVRGKLEAQVRAHCGTCLAETTVHLNPDMSVYLMPRPMNQEKWQDEELTPEDLEREWYEGDTVALDELIYDTLILEMPMNPKCGPDCPGFKQETASLEMKLDPRLAPLAELRIKKES